MAATTPSFVTQRLAALRDAELYRDPPTVDYVHGVTGRVQGREATILCSNDYLGLRLDPRIRAASAEAADVYGAGAGSSRLIAGSLPLHDAFEEELADWMGTDAALLCSSGYQANLAMLGALPSRGDLVASDALNHASLIDGCRLSRATIRRVPHADVDLMRAALEGAPAAVLDADADPDAPERFLLGEGLYSMDGDRGPVDAWSHIAEDTGAHFLLDEAHALGVLGPQGRGAWAEAAAEEGGLPAPMARVGTFGKAFGAHGAFIATCTSTRELLVNAGRTFVFSTALPPPAVGAARAALAIIRSDEGAERRDRVIRLSERLATGARDLGFSLASFDCARPTPIVPIVFGTPVKAQAVARHLFEHGLYAKAIRPPTVPEGTSRIRFALSANHTEAHVDAALAALSTAA